MADRLASDGAEVVVVRRGPARTPDFLVDGEAIEVKTVSGVARTDSAGLLAAIASRVMDGRGQAAHVLVDATGQSGMTFGVAERAIRRASRADITTGARLHAITILTLDGSVAFRRIRG